jgi:hypothetical protein
MLRKILEQIKIKLSNRLVEYFIYLMKCFNDEGRSINDLKYENLFKVLKEYENIDNEEEEEEEEGEEEEEDADKLDTEESAIEITTEEYLKKVENVIKKICHVLNTSNIKLDDLFTDCVVSMPNFNSHAIELVKLVQILNEEFNIILDSIDIYCLFTKLKYITENEGEENENDITDEIVDFDKLKSEVELFMKKENVKISQNSNMNLKQEYELDMPSEDFIQKIKIYLKMNKINFDDFINSISSKILISNVNNGTNEKENLSNRYIDIGSFENFLVVKEIIVLIVDPINSKNLMLNKNSHKIEIDNNILYNNKKINMDYLKYIIEENSETDKSIIRQFVTYNSNSPVKEIK